jgi:hypothetical protein
MPQAPLHLASSAYLGASGQGWNLNSLFVTSFSDLHASPGLALALACPAARMNHPINQQRSAVINLASFVESGTIHSSSLRIWQRSKNTNFFSRSYR